MNIQNQELLRALKFACGKFRETDELTEEDLSDIYELNLSDVSVTGKNYDIDLKELPELPNLRKLSLRNFVIADDEVKFINENRKLMDLSFDRCTFDARTIPLYIESLKALSMRYCDNLGGLRFLAPERLKLLGMDKVDIAAIRGLERVKSLSLQSSRVYRLGAIRKCEDLRELRLDGTEYSPIDQEYIDVLGRDNKIKISKEEYYHPTM